MANKQNDDYIMRAPLFFCPHPILQFTIILRLPSDNILIDLIFKLLRLLEPEISHVLSLKLLKLAHNIGLLRLLSLSYSDNHFSEKNLQGMSPYRTLQACPRSASQAFSTQTACISSTCERTSNCTRVTRSRRCARVTRFHWVPCATETRHEYAAGLVLVQRPTPCPPTKRTHT